MNKYKERLNKASDYLNKQDIDLWLMYASEGSDPCVAEVIGLNTIGKTFFLIHRDSRRYAIASIIDAQESEDSGLFDDVFRYTSKAGDVLRDLLAEIDPNKIALNYSKDYSFCDGLTVGRYRWLMREMGVDMADRTVQSEPVSVNFMNA